MAIENARRTDTGLFVSVERALARTVSFHGGLRGDLVTTENRGGYFGDLSTTNSALSGHASITVGSLRGFSATGQVARGFRDARISDRYFRGVTGRGFITGNPDLEPETSVQFDGALRYTASRWRWALYFYEYRIDDLIERFEEGDDLYFFRNRGRARLRGVEVEAQGELGRGIAVELGGQVTKGKALDDGAPLDDIGPENIWAQIRKDLGSGFLQMRAAVYGADEEAGPTEIETPSYVLLDAAAGWRLSEKAELRFLARNLLDVEYPLSSDRRAPLAPGISGIVTLLVSF
jgi:outer membrane receptor protein involved in Fe transport